jgi:hypothetical protein
MDALLSIAIRSDYPTISSFICTCKYFSQCLNIWQLACESQFQDKSYFDFWTPKENYLVHARGIFALTVNFSTEEVSNYIYEYDPMLLEMFETTNAIINEGQGYTTPTLLKFSIESQFIIVMRDFVYDISIVGQSASYESAKSIIQKDQLRLIRTEDNDLPDDMDFEYIIINLEDTIPRFWKIKVLKPSRCFSEAGDFYGGTSNKPIQF